jgi:[ribosomal protein S5]-alanine N-acetyltransferase
VGAARASGNNSRLTLSIGGFRIGEMNVAIRIIHKEDAPALQRCASDAKVAQTSGIPHPYPSDGAIRWIEKSLSLWKAGKERAYVILGDSEFVGSVSLRNIDGEMQSAELEYFVGSPFWGKGVASEASRQAIEIAFTDLALDVLYARCLEVNLASARVLEKNGFQEIERVVDDCKDDSKFSGMVWRRFRLAKPEW